MLQFSKIQSLGKTFCAARGHSCARFYSPFFRRLSWRVRNCAVVACLLCFCGAAATGAAERLSSACREIFLVEAAEPGAHQVGIDPFSFDHGLLVARYLFASAHAGARQGAGAQRHLPPGPVTRALRSDFAAVEVGPQPILNWLRTGHAIGVETTQMAARHGLGAELFTETIVLSHWSAPAPAANRRDPVESRVVVLVLLSMPVSRSQEAVREGLLRISGRLESGRLFLTGEATPPRSADAATAPYSILTPEPRGGLDPSKFVPLPGPRGRKAFALIASVSATELSVDEFDGFISQVLRGSRPLN